MLGGVIGGGVGPRVALARMVTNERKAFTGLSRFETADLPRLLVHPRRENNRAVWTGHQRFIETPAREICTTTYK